MFCTWCRIGVWLSLEATPSAARQLSVQDGTVVIFGARAPTVEEFTCSGAPLCVRRRVVVNQCLVHMLVSAPV